MFRRAIAVAGIAGLTAAGTAVPAAADGDRPRLRGLLRQLTAEGGAPGALAQVDGPDGRTVITSGVGDVRTGAPVPKRSHWRIGSITKTFTATVVLQLVGEGEVELDAPVARYLPGTVDERITVRHLLQHTSGLPDYLDHMDMREMIDKPFTHYDRDDLLELALAQPPLFEPGEGWSYSNTNYLLAGMLIEEVTGHSYRAEVRRRIIEPLDLRGTIVPGDFPFLPRPHARGYVRPGPGAPLLDRTWFNPSAAFGGGNLVSTASDLNRFFGALLDGRLLRPSELREMMAVRTTGRGDGYGLGLRRSELPCGGYVWGHGGDMIGFSALAGATPDGRRAVVMVNLNPGGSDAQDDRLEDALETALCGG